MSDGMSDDSAYDPTRDGRRTDTREARAVTVPYREAPLMADYDDRDDDRYVPVQNHDDFDPEAFRRMFIAYMTAVCVLAIVVAALVLLGAGVIVLIGAMF